MQQNLCYKYIIAIGACFQNGQGYNDDPRSTGSPWDTVSVASLQDLQP